MPLYRTQKGPWGERSYMEKKGQSTSQFSASSLAHIPDFERRHRRGICSAEMSSEKTNMRHSVVPFCFSQG